MNALKTLGFFRRKLAAAPLYVKLTAYKTLVRPILEYGSIVWNPYQKEMAQKLESVQNKVLQFIYSKYLRHQSISTLRDRAALPTLACRHWVAAMKLLFMLYHDKINRVNKYCYVQPPHCHSIRTCHIKHIRQYPTKWDTYIHFFRRQ